MNISLASTSRTSQTFSGGGGAGHATGAGARYQDIAFFIPVKALPSVSGELGVSAFVVIGHAAVVGAPRPIHRYTGSAVCQRCACRSRLSTLLDPVTGSPSDTRNSRGIPLAPRSSWPVRVAGELYGVEALRIGDLDRGHHLIPERGSGTPYTPAAITSGCRRSTRSMPSADAFSPSTRIQSPRRPAK